MPLTEYIRMDTISKTPVEVAFEESGLTYREVGERIGVSAQGACEIIKGRSKNPVSRYALATALGHMVNDLFPTWPNREDDAERAAA